MDYEKSKKINEVNRKIFECNNAKVMVAEPVSIAITHLSDGINSPYPDYAPTINADETIMVFTTRRPEDNTNEKVAVDHEYYEDIFYSTKVNGEWSPARNMAGPLNNRYHNSSINLSPDGKEMLLYHDSNGGDIFFANVKPDGTWTDPDDLEGINTQYIENSATITADGNTIYFVSNRPGGLGGTDIYVSSKDSKGKWMNAQNLGNLVNTELDEEAVFISANGKHLYFSSNGHAGMGDMDIYRSTYNEVNKTWDRPVNMGYPINSVENDIYFVLTGDEGFAYISSVRDQSYGDEDIYKLDIHNWKAPSYTRPEYAEALLEEVDPLVQQIATNTVTPQSHTVKFNVFVAEGSSRKPITANVALANAQGEIQFKETGTGLYQTEIKKGNYGGRYKLHVTSNEYVPYSSTYHFFGNGLTETAISDTIYLDKIAVNYNRILNVYFPIDSDVPKSFDDIRYLEQIMKTSSTLKVEISGHTDNTGAAEYNLGLSRRRSEAVKKILVAAGIDASRITVSGYGSEKPLADNKTREGRRLNRRTEFTIIEK
jgi:outer membrane protein OmpA-like peptidoglycan-associated protein